MSTSVRTIADGLVFPESPRWHGDLLWVSDMFGNQVLTVDGSGAAQTVARFDDNPSGLGFLPDGTVLLVLRNSRQVVSLAAGTSRLYRDLAETGAESLNDMVVDRTGRAFVGCLMRADRGASGSDQILTIDPDGTCRIAASGLSAPNGMALSPDGGTLVMAATWRKELVAMTIGRDGILTDRRRLAVMAEATPDGICLDAHGAVWLGGLASGQFLRVRPDGGISDVISVGEQWAIACVLGGPDRRTLYMTVSRTVWPVDARTRGSVMATTVEVPGAGIP